jgi:hypothetical protein
VAIIPRASVCAEPAVPRLSTNSKLAKRPRHRTPAAVGKALPCHHTNKSNTCAFAGAAHRCRPAHIIATFSQSRELAQLLVISPGATLIAHERLSRCGRCRPLATPLTTRFESQCGTAPAARPWARPRRAWRWRSRAAIGRWHSAGLRRREQPDPALEPEHAGFGHGRPSGACGPRLASRIEIPLTWPI